MNENKTDEQKADITVQEDFSIGVMHLISLEEHFLFSFMKTRKEEYLAIYKEIRKMRILFMKKLLKNFDGELWCISKHLLGSAMRFMETGAKSLTEDEKQEAIEFYKAAFDLYGLFQLLQSKGEKNDAGKSKKSQKI